MLNEFDEALYAKALREAEGGVRRDGLWGKALAKSMGDERRAQSLYIEYLVQALRAEEEATASVQAKKKSAKPDRDSGDWSPAWVALIALIIILLLAMYN